MVRFFTILIAHLTGAVVISFRIKTTDLDTGFYPEIQCIAHSHDSINYLHLEGCESEDVEIIRKEEIEIPMSDISVSIEEYTERTVN